MARKTFSAEVKKEAVNAMFAGNLTQKQIAKKFGCSVAVLQVWRKELKDKLVTNKKKWDEKNWELADENTVGCPHVPQQDGNAQELIRQFWNKNYRAVDMLLTPSDVSAEEAVKLVNEALQFAHDQK